MEPNIYPRTEQGKQMSAYLYTFQGIERTNRQTFYILVFFLFAINII